MSALRYSLAVLAGVMPASLHAQSIDDNYWLEGSYSKSKIDSKIRIDNLNTARPGTEIDLESDLGFDNSDSLLTASGGAKLGNNWRLIGEYYAIKRSSTKALSQDININDVTYLADASVTAGFNSNIYRVGVGYDVSKGEHHVVGGMIGLHATDFKFSIRGDGSVNGNPAGAVARTQDALAPLPTLGLYGIYEVAPKVTLGARADYLSLSVGDYNGRLLNAQASATYRFTDNIGVGAGYRFVNYKLQVEKPNWAGEVRYKFNGPNIFLQIGF